MLRRGYRGATLGIADYWDLWWTAAKPGQRDLEQMPLWQSKIELSEKFYLSIVSDSIPVDLRALGALRANGGGGLAIDIYAWLAHRMSYQRLNPDPLVRLRGCGAVGAARCLARQRWLTTEPLLNMPL